MEPYPQREDRRLKRSRDLQIPTPSHAIQSSLADLNPRKRQCTAEAVVKCSTATDPIYLSPFSKSCNYQNMAEFKRSWSTSPSQFHTESISIPSTPGTEASSPTPSTDISTPSIINSNSTAGEGMEENLDAEVECMDLDSTVRIRDDDVCIGMVGNKCSV